MQLIDELGGRIWSWRIRTQPRTRDDIPRVERPAGWLPDFSETAIAAQRLHIADFGAELAALDPGPEVADIVDHRLLRCVLARATWELDILQPWRFQPRFYVDQALGPVFDTLLRPGVDVPRVREVVRLLDAVPNTVEVGRRNLSGNAYAEFADLAIGELSAVENRMDTLASALTVLCPDLDDLIAESSGKASTALAGFRTWLIAQHSGMDPWRAVGAETYSWFLREVAVVPYSVSEVLFVGSVELDRAMTLELLERNRFARSGARRPAVAGSAAAQALREAALETQVRDFYVAQELLGQPADLGHYLNAPMPDYLEPLRFLGVTDDLTSATRLTEDGVSYVPEPSPGLPYFYAANAVDPRAGIIHEGAHYQQLALSWRHERPLRRQFYDSAANEGIAFYNEELMLAAGLFDDAPASRGIIYNFMRLRALRVAVDVGMAVGTMTIDRAADYLATEVPMDRKTAVEEAAAFAEGPGQAISYQIGKTQINALIADTVRAAARAGEGSPAIREIHDHLWRNGNVPIALTRWEMLGLTDELAKVGVILPQGDR